MAGKFDYSAITRIQQANDIVEVVSEHLSLAKKGKELVGLCPFHEDHKPSLYVNPAKQIFKCFACGAGGDVLKFVQLREKLSFSETVERLAARVGIVLTPVKNTTRKDNSESKSDAKTLERLNNWTAKFWQKSLWDPQKGQYARDYLAKRSITEDSAKHWMLGLAPDGWDILLNAAAKASISKELLLDAGLVVPRPEAGCYDKFRNRLMFPIHDATGRIIAFGGRTLGDDPAKYMNSPATALFDKSNCLYGLDKARHQIVATGTAVVVEGYTDVIMAHQAGCTNVVATLGTSFTSGQARLLRRYAKRIVLVFDSDIAGSEAANRALEVCLVEHIDIRLAFVPQGKDPCDFVLAAGADAFRKVIDQACDVMEYKWQRLQSSLANNDTIVDRKAATEEFLTSISIAFNSGRFDPISSALIVTKLSAITGLSADQINKQLLRLGRRPQNTRKTAVQNAMLLSAGAGTTLQAKAQQEILEVLLNQPGLFNSLTGLLSPEDFDDGTLREIAVLLFDILPTGRDINLTELLVHIESPQTAAVLVELKDQGAKKSNFSRRLEEALIILRNHRSNREKTEIKAVLNDDDTESLRKITQIIINTKTSNQRNPGLTAV